MGGQRVFVGSSNLTGQAGTPWRRGRARDLGDHGCCPRSSSARGEVTGLVQRTCFRDAQGAVERGATLLLGIEGLAVERVELDPDGARVAHVVTAAEAAAACPSCGVVSTSV